MDFINLRFSCGTVCDKDIYASCRNFNGLYKISLVDKKVEFLSFFQGEKSGAVGLHRDVFQYKSLLCFIPSAARDIHIYDLETKEMDVISFRSEQHEGNFVGHLVNEFLWLFPETLNRNMYKVNILTKEVTVYGWESIKDKIPTSLQSNIFSVRTVFQEGHIFLPIFGSNTILILCTDTEEFSTCELPIERLWGCYSGSDGLWILADSGHNIYRWNYKKNELKHFLQGKAVAEKKSNWNWIVETRTSVYAIPAFAESIRILEDDKFVPVIDIDESDWCINSSEQMFFAPVVDGDKIWLLPFNSRYLVMLDGYEVTRYNNMVVTDDMFPYNEYLEDAYINPGKEGERLTLRAFIKGTGLVDTQKGKTDSVGGKIWNILNR